jgi:periplasmic protein TonB
MRWSMIPVSAAAHVVAFVACVVVPLGGGLDVPTPWPLSSIADYVTVAAAPLPPEPATIPRVSDGPDPSAAPVAMPDRIAEPLADAPRSAAPAPEGGIGTVATGIGAGIGAAPLPMAHFASPQLPPTSVPPSVVHVGGVIREPRKIVNVQPVYPEIARISKIQGLVIIEATIDERGSVLDARVLRSVALLDAAALTAVRQWRYTPTLLNGVPVRVLMTVTIQFSLGDLTP